MKIFGIKTIKVNGCHVNTFNVAIKQNTYNEILAKRSGLSYTVNSGRNSDRIQFSYTSLDITEFNDKVAKLGEVLKEVAQNKLNSKYHWVK